MPVYPKRVALPTRQLHRSGAAKIGNFSLNAASFRSNREMSGLLLYTYYYQYYESS